MTRREKLMELIPRTILPEMFRRVGLSADATYIQKYTKKKDWYTKKKWTEAEEKDFMDWLTKTIKSHLGVSEKVAKFEAEWFLLYCGWSSKK